MFHVSGAFDRIYTNNSSTIFTRHMNAYMYIMFFVYLFIYLFICIYIYIFFSMYSIGIASVWLQDGNGRCTRKSFHKKEKIGGRI